MASHRYQRPSSDPVRTFGPVSDADGRHDGRDGCAGMGALRDLPSAIASGASLAVGALAPFVRHPEDLDLPGCVGGLRKLMVGGHCRTAAGVWVSNDALLEGPRGIVGVRSVLTEHLGRPRGVVAPEHREAIKPDERGLWYDEMLRLAAEPGRDSHLDVAALVTQAFGLLHDFDGWATQLLYLYWEPQEARNSPVFVRHRREVDALTRRMAGAMPRFHAMSWQELWAMWERHGSPWLRVHVQDVRARCLVSN